jgi:hypothetical protein
MDLEENQRLEIGNHRPSICEPEVPPVCQFRSAEITEARVTVCAATFFCFCLPVRAIGCERHDRWTAVFFEPRGMATRCYAA